MISALLRYRKRHKKRAMRLITWNVNGIRAAQKNGFIRWFEKEAADVVCVQETKARPEQLEDGLLHPLGYHSVWHSAEKPGYSGVAIYSKKEPLEVRYGIGVPEIDREGRVILAQYPALTVVNAYFPNSQRDHARLGYKLMFCDQMLEFLEAQRRQGRHVALCGDLNIAHTEIDLKNPKTNMDNAGFLPEERAWLGKFIQHGWIDTFRHFTRDPGHYTWWSYRPGVRQKNIGWRLDYFLMNQENQARLKAAKHHGEILVSDHCPVSLELKK